MMMPPKTVNEPKVFFMTSDGQKIPLDGISTIEPEFESSDIVIAKRPTGATFSCSNVKVVINTKNDRNYKSKRYRKNRKGYRGLCDLLM